MSQSNSEKRSLSDPKRSKSSEPNLLMKIQTATKDWESAPAELLELRTLLQGTGYDVEWSPKRLGINLLTPNKIRGMVLKRVLMKLYPFETFWITESLDETLHKCLLVCEQLGLHSNRSVVWGQCSVNAAYEFWVKVLQKANSLIGRARDDEECVQEAKSEVISALISSRGTDWDKQIARNFTEVLGNQRFPIFMKSQKSVIAHARQKGSKLGNYSNPISCRPYTANQRHSEFGHNEQTKSGATTTSLAGELKKEGRDMNEILKSIEKYYRNDSVLQIDNALKLGKAVADLGTDFENYMDANNRGGFKDVDSLTNHTHKVIKAMSKLTAVYNDFFLEFQKYFRNAGGGGDELSLSAAMKKMAELSCEGQASTSNII